MKKANSFIILFSKILAFIIRLLLRFRYKVSVNGSEVVRKNSPVLFLPNHQALMDPIILLSQIYRFSTATPVVSEKYYDIPLVNWYLKRLMAVRVSDLETGSRDIHVLKSITRSVYKGLRRNQNILIYPSGQIAGQGYEKIFNKKSAYQVVRTIPDDVQIIGVRINGLWGSMFSKANTGKSPDFFMQLLKGMLYVLANLLFFVPKRAVSIEFEDLTTVAKENVTLGQKPFNTYLEDFYNLRGEEKVLFLKHIFYLPDFRRNVAERISGSAEEIQDLALPTDAETIPEDTLEKVKSIVSSILNVAPAELSLNSNLVLDLGADSLTIVEIVSELENQFKGFSTPEINDLKTIGDLCLLVLGQFITNSDLKPSYLDPALSREGYIHVDPDKNILWQFLDTFTTNQKEYFVYDAMLGSTNRKTFLLKAAVISELIKKKVKDQYVGIMLPALQSTTLLIIATYMAGKIPVMLNWTVGKKVLEHCTETAGVNVILSADGFLKKIEDQLPESIKSKLLLLEKEVPKIGISSKIKGLIVSKFPKQFIDYKQINSTAVILFTSGSEALPKAVPLTHVNICSDLHNVFKMLSIESKTIFLGFLPPFHSFGFTALCALPLVSGIRIAYTPNPTDAREVLKILKHTQSNLLVGTPGFLKILMSAGSAYYFKSVRYVISGAEAMTLAVKELFDSLTNEAKLLEGYGITECAPILSANPIEKQKMNSVGKFIPGIEYQIIDLETGKPVLPGQAGMIYVQGKNVFHGYLGEEKNNPFEEINGKSYYKTGDLGYLDEEGYLFITGRLKRFIKIAGEMISLPFIEKILLEQYGEQEKQVLAVEGSDNTTPAQIVLFTTIPISLDETNNYLLKNGVAPIAKIKRIIELDEIPVLGTGKTDYKVLRRMLEEQ
ncbi:MAG: AMP-binding protein [Bacteroidetes bacterium]|nr:AMP-binding protein [Bacteroidota bacterium]